MNTNTIIKILKNHSKETGTKPFTTQIQYKPFSKAEYYEYTNSSVLIRFKSTVFDTKSNIKLFPDSQCQNFPSTDHLFLKFTDDNKVQTFDTHLLLNAIRTLEKNPKTHQKETKKHRFIDFSYNNRCFTNYHDSTLPNYFRVDSYHLKTIIRIFSTLQCNETTITYNEDHPHRTITLECDLATAILAPMRYMD